MAFRSLCTVSCLIGLVAAAAPLAAQTEPDFSGRWVLELQPAPADDVPRVLSVRQSLARTNVRGEPMKPFFKDITIARELESGRRSETYLIGVIGGVVPGVREDGRSSGPKTFSTVRWDGGEAGRALVIETGRYTGSARETGEWMERREVWSLDPEGRLHVSLTTRGSAEAARTIGMIYRRQ